MGQDYTGDISNPENIKYLMEKCKEFGDITLITADGSIDTHENAREKEMILYKYQFQQLVAALKVLANEGHLIWKTFSLFNENNICLMYFLNLIFEKVSIFKPLSGPIHSFEIFIVCEKFQKKTRNLKTVLDVMLSEIDNRTPIFPRNFIPKEFIEEHLKR